MLHYWLGLVTHSPKSELPRIRMPDFMADPGQIPTSQTTFDFTVQFCTAILKLAQQSQEESPIEPA